jgi:hypothetical protein
MIFNLDKWVVDIDVNKTRMYYSTLPQNVNEKYVRYCNNMIVAERDFFNKMGVDVTRIITEKVYSNEEDTYFIKFLMCGKFLSIPRQQIQMYEDVFEEKINVDCSNEQNEVDDIKVGNIFIRFKHPLTHFENIKECWECGYVCGMCILKI